MYKPVLAAALCLFSTTAIAQDSSRTILVLDGSGSMWGQIDGKAKITIAQEVIGGLLQSLPVEQQLGLTVYGHRRKGDCGDIETIVQPGADTRGAIADAVNRIQPKGKTPMTDAVIAAAKALRYTEEKATVILVSDGIETCNPNVCLAAQQLEATGVDFTAHVVGFNISDPKAIAQMQCLAGETGGTFLSAENADELAAALVTVAAAPLPEPEPVPVQISFSATLETNGPKISSGLVWSFADDAAETSAPGGAIQRELLPGTYRVTVLRLQDEFAVDADIVVTEATRSVVLVLPKIVVTAVIAAPEQAPIGSTIDVRWSAQTVEESDYISIARPDQNASLYKTFEYAKGDGTLGMVLPLIPGDYEVRYIRNPKDGSDEILTTQIISVTDLSAQLEAEAEINAGAEFEVTWQGPNYKNDYITIASPDDKATAYASYTYTARGNTLSVTAPLDTGDYEIRYVANGSPDRVLGTRTITVVANSATLVAADTAVAGSQVEVVWEGPANKNDYISVAAPDDAAQKYVGYTYTNKGTPLGVTMPLNPGTYEIRYIANGNPDKVLASRVIEVVLADVALEAVDEAVAGSLVDVTWQGPDNKGDYVSVARVGEKAQKYFNYKNTHRGTTVAVKMPLEPGTYELRYIGNGSPDQVLASRRINVVAAVVTLDAAGEAVAGSLLSVTWDGPDNAGDFISVAAIGEDANRYVTYRNTVRGNPVEVNMPLEPGDYQIRYIANGSPDQILASRAVKIVAAQVVLDAPGQGVVGTSIDVSYVGPDNAGDYIAVAEIGSASNKFVNYRPTIQGNPASVKLPDEPGTYLIRYVANGSPDKVLARRTIKVVAASAKPAVVIALEAVDTVGVGDALEIFWVGPDEDGDTVALFALGSNEPLASVATANGNPAVLTVPNEPGQYMLRYVSGQSSKPIGSRPIAVN